MKVMSDDDPDITLTPNEWTIHAREKVSTGDYETHEVHTTLSGSVSGVDQLDDQTHTELKARLLAAQRELQAVVTRTAENRIREDGHEDWGVWGDSDE